MAVTKMVGDMTLAVDKVFVDVMLTLSGGIEILSECYYARGGYLTLYDPGSLINFIRQ